MTLQLLAMLTLTIGMFGVCAAEPAQANTAAQPKAPVRDPKNAELPGWKLVWSDEFDTDGPPDPKKWNYETGFVRNAELQYYTNARLENARVEKGCLVIEARKEHFANPNHESNASAKEKDWNKSKEFAEYTSASLTTANSASWTYSRIEVRAKIPKGRGTWPAIWTLGTDINKIGWPACGEIDILENVGFDPDGIHTTVHTGAYNHVKKTAKGHREQIKNPFDDFHVFAVEWTKKAIDFIVDDKKVFSFENDGKGDPATWPYDKPEYLILNLAIGGGWGGAKGVDDSIFPQKFLIDYVRVYEKVGEK
jgi:beta-glucanase (GH16 family)